MENNKNNLYVIIALLAGLILGYVLSNSGIIPSKQLGQTIKGADTIVRDDSVSKKIYSFDQKQVSEMMSSFLGIIKSQTPESIVQQINSGNSGSGDFYFVICVQPDPMGGDPYIWYEQNGSVGIFGAYFCIPASLP